MHEPQDPYRLRWATPEEPEVPAPPSRRTRLQPSQQSELHPFVRAAGLKDISLYWMPVSVYPMRSRERRWLLLFLNLLRDHLAQEKKLRIESFLQFKSLDADLMDTFLRRAQEYQPLAGLSAVPGKPMPPAPKAKDIEDAVNAGGPVDVQQWMADYCYWMLRKQDERQREDFFGQGAMMFLFMQPDPETTPPPLDMPRYLRTNPSLDHAAIQEQMHVGFALKDKFLAKSKELLGAPLAQDPSYPGLPFIVPLLSSEAFIQATAEQRAVWFELFDAYCIESTQDRGFLFATKEADFDRPLLGLLDLMRESGMEYPR